MTFQDIGNTHVGDGGKNPEWYENQNEIGQQQLCPDGEIFEAHEEKPMMYFMHHLYFSLNSEGVKPFCFLNTFA